MYDLQKRSVMCLNEMSTWWRHFVVNNFFSFDKQEWWRHKTVIEFPCWNSLPSSSSHKLSLHNLLKQCTYAYLAKIFFLYVVERKNGSSPFLVNSVMVEREQDFVFDGGSKQDRQARRMLWVWRYVRDAGMWAHPELCSTSCTYGVCAWATSVQFLHTRFPHVHVFRGHAQIP